MRSRLRRRTCRRSCSPRCMRISARSNSSSWRRTARMRTTARAGTACLTWAATASIACATKTIRYPERVTQSKDWDGAAYQKRSEPQFRWGLAVLERLELHGDETVLDLGCGSGRLTAKLLERLPRGRVIAADASPSMLAQARSQLAGFGDRVQF